MQILASAKTLATKRTNQVKGDYTVAAGMAQLLAGTGLVGVPDSASGILTIRDTNPVASVEYTAVQATSSNTTSIAEGPQPATSADSMADTQIATTEVVVTGIKRSLQKSAAAKKASNSIVEVVTAEDIGKLPGLSIAESLARMPGVAAQRVDGRAQVLSIRGLAPKFGVTLLNGQEMVSTGDDRSFEYDQFPAELVSSATLYKTPDASLGTMGLSGTVDIRTLQPLDFHGRKINVSARVDSNSIGDTIPGTKSTGNRLSFSYIDQFADGKIGVAIGYAHLDSPNQKQYFNPWDYGTGNDLGVNGVTTAYTFNGFETGVASTKTVRDGLLGVVQFKPNDTFTSQVNLFHSKFQQRMDGRELVGVLANWASGSTPSATIGTAGVTVTNASPILTMRKDNRDDQVDAISWTNSFELGEWKARADLGVSHAKRKEWMAEAYAMPTTPITFTVALPTGYDAFGKVASTFDFGNGANYRLAGAWWGGGAYGAVAQVDDKMTTARLSAKRSLDWGVISAFEGGLIYGERDKTLTYVGTNYNFKNASPCLDGLVCAPMPSGLLQSSVDLGFAGVPHLISFDVGQALASGAYIASPNDPKSPAWNWGVNEKVTTAFAKFDINYQSAIPIRGNFGLQAVSAKQSATGLYVDASGARNPIQGGTDYTDVLPSLNLIAELGNATYLRFGAAKAVARPNMADMRAGITASVNTSDHQWYGSGGNPNLKPWQSNDYDVSLEKYFGKGAYVAVAAFIKDVTTGIVTKDVAYDFTGFVNPSGITPTSNMGTLTTPTNTSGGKVQGWELSGTLDGGQFHPALEGFELIGSFSKTKVKASTDADGVRVGTLLEGLSGEVWTATAYYENHGFQARIGERYRSGFTATRHNAFRFVTDTIRPEKIVDAQIGYTIPSGPMKDMAISLQANNLTNTPYVVTQTVDGHTIVKEHHEFGTEYLLGVSFSF
ncbi:TonB-dependent receptor [Asticcacaulis sp. MM231]|uniref:TonB-dependent receptor n=1 Tax=Asticcacaulis sp. MM231 TaxID=3157666 RepID=UPI0032D58912